MEAASVDILTDNVQGPTLRRLKEYLDWKYNIQSYTGICFTKIVVNKGALGVRFYYTYEIRCKTSDAIYLKFLWPDNIKNG